MKRFWLILCVTLLAVACATSNVPAPGGGSQTTRAQTATQRSVNEHERQTLNKALLKAAEAGETAKVSALLNRGADANASNSIRVSGSPLTALMLAVVHGHVETARGLIDKGANVNATADFPDSGTTAPQKGVTALMQAAASGDLPMVKLLVEHGAEVNARDGDGATALMGTTDGKVIVYLIEHKADPNVKDKAGNTALINLAKHSRFGDASSVAAAGALLSKGADVNAANGDGETPLAVAEQTGKDELVALFKKAGAKR